MRRREFLQGGAALTAIAALPHGAFADTPFTPKPEVWRKFEITTRVEIANPSGKAQAWLPLPADGAVWSRFDNSTTSGLGTLAYALGPVDLTAMFRNWALANYLDDAGFSNIDPKYTHKSWNARSIYGTVFGSYISTVFTPLGYPLKVTPLSEGVGAPVSDRVSTSSG